MTHTIVYDPTTRAILVVDPQVDQRPTIPTQATDGTWSAAPNPAYLQPILPFHLPPDAFASISDTEAAKFSTPSSSFTLGPDNLTVVVTPVAPPLTPLRDAVVAQAQSAVGVTLGNLTQAQRLALIACVLYREGALDPVTLAVRPLNQWLG